MKNKGKYVRMICGSCKQVVNSCYNSRLHYDSRGRVCGKLYRYRNGNGKTLGIESSKYKE